MTRSSLFSHYDTLRVDRGAAPECVRKAYRQLAQQFHPDKHPGKSAAAQVMAQINQAYEVLSDPAARAAYDSWLEAENNRPRVARPAASVFTPDRFGWAGWLLFATTSLTVLTVGYVVLATWRPAPAAPPPQPAVHVQAPSEAAPRTMAAGSSSSHTQAP
jgi:curved DNA-binding protein CbpA